MNLLGPFGRLWGPPGASRGRLLGPFGRIRGLLGPLGASPGRLWALPGASWGPPGGCPRRPGSPKRVKKHKILEKSRKVSAPPCFSLKNASNSSVWPRKVPQKRSQIERERCFPSWNLVFYEGLGTHFPSISKASQAQNHVFYVVPALAKLKKRSQIDPRNAPQGPPAGPETCLERKRKAESGKTVASTLRQLGSGACGGPALVQAVFRYVRWPRGGASCVPVRAVASW